MKRLRAVVIGGTSETSLHPVPPVADSAPEWNVFRLAEAQSDLDIHVISPCETGQLPDLRSFPARGNYHHVVFSRNRLCCYRKCLRHLLPLRLAVRRMARLPDLMSLWYLRRVIPLVRQLRPDVVIINGRPQYIRYLRRALPASKLLMFMRGPIGESRRFLHWLDGIIVNSEGMRRHARELLGSASIPVWLMPNTLGDEFVVPDIPADRFTRRPPRLMFAGRIIPEKGVLELLNAFELVLNKVPDAKLMIYGASDNYKFNGDLTPYEKAVRERAARLPTGCVEFRGYVPNREMGAHYVQVRLAVFPSICLESFGMVALEAMRCHTPVVASRRPGFEELILHGKTGLIVDDPADATALAAALLQVLENDQLASAMGEAAYFRSLDYRPELAAEHLASIVGKSVRPCSSAIQALTSAP